ncbi:serine endopeptidase, partial [Thozetella sp. PMI_491]
FTGVAPEATILSYKVFSNGINPSTDEATLIDAFLRAYDDGVDIITASIGDGSGWSDGPWATVASRLVDQGIVVTISAGNDGWNGPFSAGTGSSGKNVIAVASIDPTVNAVSPFAATFTLAGVSNATYVGYRPAGEESWNLTENIPIVPITLNTTDAAQSCSTLPDTTPSLNGSIALIRGGGCTFKQKQTYAAQFGASRILIYDDDTPRGSLIAVDSSVPVGLIELRAGVAMVNTIVEGGSVTANFAIPEDANWKVAAYNAAGGIPSDYTSWGGTNDLGIKPDIAAPGRDIFSTYLDGAYKVLSGTSMACPYVAGIAALYIGKYGGRAVHGTTFANLLVKKIISSGASVPWQIEQPEGVPVDYGFWAPVPQVGTGLVNASKVLSYKTSLSFTQFALNDTANFSGSQTVDITNNGAEAVTYTFSLQPAAGFNLKSNYSTSFLVYLGELEPLSIIPSVAFPQDTFTVPPGETRTAQITFSLPRDTDSSGLPIYSGKILISGGNGEELSVPYLGAAFDLVGYLRDNLFTNNTPRQLGGTDSQDIDLYHTYNFDLRVKVRSYPQVLTRYRWGTQQVRWDLFEAGWSESQWAYPPIVGENGYIGSATSFADSGDYATFIPALMDKEDTIPFPVTYLPRTDSYTGVTVPFWWFGKLANGTYIAPGNYTMRFAALLPLSDPAKSDSWDIWETPEITILSYTP